MDVQWNGFCSLLFRIPYPCWVSEQSHANLLLPSHLSSTYFSSSTKEMTEIEILLPLGGSWKQQACFLKARHTFYKDLSLLSFLKLPRLKNSAWYLGKGLRGLWSMKKLAELCFPTPSLVLLRCDLFQSEWYLGVNFTLKLNTNQIYSLNFYTLHFGSL